MRINAIAGPGKRRREGHQRNKRTTKGGSGKATVNLTPTQGEKKGGLITHSKKKPQNKNRNSSGSERRGWRGSLLQVEPGFRKTTQYGRHELKLLRGCYSSFGD